MVPETIPTDDELSPAVQLELSDNGGHVGFIGGSLPWRTKRWMDQRMVEWLKHQMGPEVGIVSPTPTPGDP